MIDVLTHVLQVPVWVAIVNAVIIGVLAAKGVRTSAMLRAIRNSIQDPSKPCPACREEGVDINEDLQIYCIGCGKIRGNV